MRKSAITVINQRIHDDDKKSKRFKIVSELTIFCQIVAAGSGRRGPKTQTAAVMGTMGLAGSRGRRGP